MRHVAARLRRIIGEELRGGEPGWKARDQMGYDARLSLVGLGLMTETLARLGRKGELSERWQVSG